MALEQLEYSFCEGNGTVEVCVQLIQTPIGGLQYSIIVDLSLANGTKAGRVECTDNAGKPDHNSYVLVIP